MAAVRQREAARLEAFARLRLLTLALTLSTPPTTLLAMLWVRQRLTQWTASAGSGGSGGGHDDDDDDDHEYEYDDDDDGNGDANLSLATLFTAVALVGTLQSRCRASGRGWRRWLRQRWSCSASAPSSPRTTAGNSPQRRQQQQQSRE